MLQPNLMPAPDPNPLPAPYWVFKLLLVVTFVLHILAMNSMLGGAVLAVAAKARTRKDKYAGRLFFDIAKKLPALLPATITLGVAPLLFVQVLYGQYFYTSSVIVAWPWLLVLAMLTVAYYGFYFAASRNQERPGRAGAVLLWSTVLIAAIGFIYSNNMMLSQTPAAWRTKYFGDPSGWNLNLAEPTLLPRYLHFFTAAVAVGGLLLAALALVKWERDGGYARYLFRFGGRAFLFATMAQFAIGFWFVVSLPRDIAMLFMGDNAVATVLFGVGIGSGLSAIFIMAHALRTERIRLGVYGGAGATAVIVIAMCVLRDMLRDRYLEPYRAAAGEFAVKTQWSVLPLFLVVFLAGVALWIVMMRRYDFAARANVEDRRA
jgi:hypothetical protein